MNEHAPHDLLGFFSSAGSAIAAKTLGFTGIAGIAAGAVAMSLTLPKTRNEFFCRLVVTVLTSIFIGPVVVEYLDMTHYTIQSQIGVCFITGVPSWLIWSYFILQLEKAQKKTPSQIALEISSFKKNIKK